MTILNTICIILVLMIKDKLLLSNAVKLLRSSSFISIVISICLLVNLFTPSFSIISMSKEGEFPCEQHICGCKTAPDCLNHCCCVKGPSMLDMKCTLNENPKDITSVFIQSIACAGVPDQFIAVPNIISLPGDSIFIPDIYPFHCLKKLHQIFPISFPISPPDKPPRIT